MMTIMNSVNKNDIQNVFGYGYTSVNDTMTLTDNYNSLLSRRGNLLSKLYYFIDISAVANTYTLSLLDIDLLSFNETEATKSSFKSIIYFPQYYNYEELMLFSILKRIAIKEELTKEEIKILYDFIRSNYRIEQMLNKSGSGNLVVDKKTIEELLSLVSKRQLTIGHKIRIYENLCRELNFASSKSQIKKLEYKITSN